MTHTAAATLLDTLCDWNVEVIFGLPGDGINGLMEGLRQRQDRIRFIQVRHEESAALMACGYAKYTGKLGVCLATSGPGGLHLLNGLYDAKLDGQPVLAITGHHYHDLIDTHAQQDVDLDRVFMDVAVYNARIMGPSHVEQVTNLACRTALSRRGVAHINFPVDLQEQEDGEHSKRAVPGHTAAICARRAGLPNAEDVQRAAHVLNAGKKIAILVGQGALHATDELEQVAEKLGAPIIKALLGKAAVPDESPYTTGGIGLLGTRPSQDALEACDTLLMVGTSFPYIEFLPKPDQARAVQIDVDPMRIGLRYPVEVGLAGDSQQTLQVLLPWLERSADRSFLADGPGWHERMVGIDGGTWHPARHADETASSGLGAGEATHKHRDRLFRLRHDRDMVCAATASEARTDVLPIRDARDDGEWLALYHCRAGSVSRPTVYCLCRRWGFLDANGRVCYRSEVSVADQSYHHQE